MKNQARRVDFAKISVLNLYKNALATKFKGIWLPTNHKSTFLAKLRRVRKYEKEKKTMTMTKTSRAGTLTLDASTSPISQNSITQNHASTSNQTSNQVSLIDSTILIPPPSQFADDVHPPPSQFADDVHPPPSQFADDVRSLRSSTRKPNSLSLQTPAPSSVIAFLICNFF